MLAPRRNGAFGGHGGGKLAHTNGTRLEVKGLTFSVPPEAMAETSDGRLWIASADTVQVLQDSGKVNAEYRLPNVQMLYCDPFGELHAGDGHHLFRFNGKRFQRVEKLGLTELCFHHGGPQPAACGWQVAACMGLVVKSGNLL